ncbi:isoprenyl transferase [Pseudoglutamicibacter cumminsii]|uniref:Isoprenyl transferase n=1 Tax=Pseudoglutamicibacter cumminsii TaxID=156979 RepID=A0AAP4FEJ3_9MICC|nr:isoprenyl transferase [Pseudoglutamicibacter cumminsii]MCT1686639.1 isoprenyl transferase [Pseudoglutamicibacter cumminsii]MDK6274888.1 isoprenyl transferase [Pseudoglutamicibacter cumminsii]MDK7083751.1 isoprenyl transferase [Pseudoglutamicibacter cumminsii]MDZ3746138.1 isoprenyl transferase [Pseudoglutamicibacter cumminsii]
MKLPKVSWPPRFLYGLYERRLARELKPEKLPGHIGVMVDGNRRWAKLAGASTASGHRAGADKILEFLEWCRELGIRTVTLYMLSTENLNRDSSEVGALLRIIDETLTRVGSEGSMRVHPVGALDVLPPELADKLRGLRDSTADRTGLHVNVAVGYGGRREIVDAVRALLEDADAKGMSAGDVAGELDADMIAKHLYTSGQPDPDLVIRTSGEQRLSGFLMWQSAYSEFYFCEALWPAFRRVDFLRALRDYQQRQRRYGG